MKIKHALAALALGQLVMVGQASAACVAGNIAGTWYTHQVFFNSTDSNDTDGWLRCKLVVNSSGGVSTLSRCADETGGILTISAGTLKVGTTCLVTGSFTVLRSGVLAGRPVLRFGQMDVSHNSFSGLGVVSDQPAVKFSLEAVKQ